MKKIDFPRTLQTYDYDCGAKALQGILTYYGEKLNEGDIIKFAKTCPEKGTLIKNILKVLKKFKLEFSSKTMTLSEIEKNIDKKIPTLVLLQAWANKKVDYTKDYNNGHWVVAIGYNQNKIFFEDPFVFNLTSLTKQEFIDRWHGKEGSKKIINHGISVFGKDPKFNPDKIIRMK